MPKKFSFAEVGIDVSPGQAAVAEPPTPEEPFEIGLLGDFSGRANRGLLDTKLSSRRPLAVDRDNYEAVLARLGAGLRLAVGGTPIELRFREFDDFHPDRLFAGLGLFQSLRRTRDELLDPATFRRAAEVLRAPEPPPPPPAAPVSPEYMAPHSLDELLAQSIQETETRTGEAQPAPRLRDEWSQFIHDLVAPYIVPGAPPEQAKLVAEVDSAIGAQMRALLHQPDFQALEAAWRGVFFLVRRLETGVAMRLRLVDVSKAELAADLAACDDVRRSETWKLLVEQSVGTPGAPLWALLAGNYTFEASQEDFELLGRLAVIARQAGAPFLAGVSPRILGCESLVETPDPYDWPPLEAEVGAAWEALRRQREAAWLGLLLPRFLLRLPYGRETDPVEAFAFEEMPAPPAHQHYLWGNPAFADVCLLGQAFSESGWSFRPGQVHELDGLPAHIYVEAGEPVLKPCAEVVLTERAAEEILDRGPMPLVSVRGRDAARVVRFQSVAQPAARLAGRWE
jgi:type VI secretion system protein ImpC